MKCSHAFRKTHDGSVECRILQDRGKKWAFCIHQYYCRASGRGEIREAADCKIKRSADKEEL